MSLLNTIVEEKENEMEKKSNSAKSSGISFCGLLAIAFIVLKLCGVISWSWWWVTAPIWIPIAITIIILIGYVIYATSKSKHKSHSKK